MRDKPNKSPENGAAQPEPPRSRRRRVLTVLAWTTAAVVLLCGAGLGYLLVKFNGNLRSIDISTALGTDRPTESSTGAMNILLLGSDSRSGSNGRLAGGATDGTARSDTAMVVHVNEAHDKADIVSIPRDTLVSRPSCTSVKGTATLPAAEGVMFNSAYEVGGAVCAVKTVEAMTGLRMDHYVEVDFAGFAKLIDALGGVTVTTTVDIDDADSELHLLAGTHHLSGTTALAFVRTRHGVGDGSDLGRIELQQQMMKSILTQVEAIGLFGNPAKLLELGDAATKAITTDSELGSVTSLVSFANSLKSIGPDDVTSVTMPTQAAPSDPNRLVALEPQNTQLWTALRQDLPVPASVQALQSADPATVATG